MESSTYDLSFVVCVFYWSEENFCPGIAGNWDSRALCSYCATKTAEKAATKGTHRVETDGQYCRTSDRNSQEGSLARRRCAGRPGNRPTTSDRATQKKMQYYHPFFDPSEGACYAYG